MARDNSPQERQRKQLERKQGKRASYDRILIVSEGTETEPNYFREIRREFRLQTANIAVYPCATGTAPLQVVEYAETLFKDGDHLKNVQPKAFERVYAVFDRDDHHSYYAALNKAQTLNGKLRNDNKKPIIFEAIASVPSFELWLLLHYEMLQEPMLRTDVLRRLKIYIPNYDKGATDTFKTTQPKLTDAIQNAEKLAETFSAFTEPEPFTGVHTVVNYLTKQKP